MNPTPASQQQFCVRWNSHLGSLGAAFPQLLAGQRFVDVTLACEGHQLHCHRLVLAACSSYFENLLSENPCKHPIIIMPHDIKLWEIQALVDFMYKGEVNVSQHGLPNLLKCAEVLQIRGLHGSDAALNLNSVEKSGSDKDSNNGSAQCGQSVQPTSLLTPGGVTTIGASLNVVASGSGTVTPTGTSSSPLCNVPILTPATSTSLLTSGIGVNNISNSALQKNTGGNSSNSAVSACTSTNIVGSSTFHGTGVNHTKRVPFDTVVPSSSGKDRHQQQYSTSTPNSSIITPKLEPVDVSIVEDIDDDSITNVGDVTKTERDEADYSEGSSKQPNEKQLHHPTKTQQHLIENLDEQIDDVYRQANHSYKRKILNYLKTSQGRSPMLDHDYDENVFLDDSDDSGSETLTENKIQEQQNGQDQDQEQEQEQEQEHEHEHEQEQESRQQQTGDEGNQGNESLSDIPESGSSSLRKRPNTASTESLPSPKRPSVTPKSLSYLQSLPSTSRMTGQNYGKIRVKPNENLYENYPKIESNNNETLVQSQADDEMTQQLPPSLKFNKDEMTIFVKNPEANERSTSTPGPLIRTVRSLAGSLSAPPSFEAINREGFGGSKCTSSNVRGTAGPMSSSSSTSSGSSPVGSPSGCDDNSNRSMGIICYDTPEIGETTTVKTEIVISEEEMDSSSNCENIVCSPNVHDYNNYNNNDEADDEDDDEEDPVPGRIINVEGEGFTDETNYDDIRLDEAYEAPHTTSHQVVIPQHLTTPANMPTIIIPTLAAYSHSPHLANVNTRLMATNAQCRVPPRGNVLKNAYLVTYSKSTGRYRELVGPITVGNVNGGIGTVRYPSSSSSTSSLVQEKSAERVETGETEGQHSSSEQNGEQHTHHPSPSPSPSAVVLRNPRSNQPRSYSTEALYAALMDVKAGESIYRASQLHKVPRKTLRNWMKRWHIKSAFPMPRQLKQAAEKKRLKQMEHKMEKYNV